MNVDNKTSQKSRYGIIVLLFAGLVILYYNALKKESPQDISEVNEAVATYHNKPNENFLFASPEDFKKNFNRFCKKNDVELSITNLTFQIGQVKTARYTISKNLEFIGIVDKKNNSLKSLTLAAQGDGSIDSGADIVLAILCTIGTIDTSLTADERGNILAKLGITDKSLDSENLSTSTIKNGRKYYVHSGDDLGFLFGVEFP